MSLPPLAPLWLAVDWPPAVLPLPAAPLEGGVAPAEGRVAPLAGVDAPLAPDDPVEPLELLVGIGELTGGGVVCGWVGVLALGQPVNSRHRQPAPAIPGSDRHRALLKVECFDKFLGLYGLSRLEPRSEGGFSQSLH